MVDDLGDDRDRVRLLAGHRPTVVPDGAARAHAGDVRHEDPRLDAAACAGIHGLQGLAGVGVQIDSLGQAASLIAASGAPVDAPVHVHAVLLLHAHPVGGELELAGGLGPGLQIEDADAGGGRGVHAVDVADDAFAAQGDIEAQLDGRADVGNVQERPAELGLPGRPALQVDGTPVEPPVAVLLVRAAGDADLLRHPAGGSHLAALRDDLLDAGDEVCLEGWGECHLLSRGDSHEFEPVAQLGDVVDRGPGERREPGGLGDLVAAAQEPLLPALRIRRDAAVGEAGG